MADPVPLTDQHAARRDPSCGRLGWWSPVDLVFCGPLEQAAGGGFEAAENSFLKPVGHGLKQKRLTDVDRRLGAVEHPPALLEGGGVEPAESVSSSVRLLVPDRDGFAFHACPLLRRADIHIALVGIRSQSFSGPVQPRRSALTENRNWQEAAACARNERDRRFESISLRQRVPISRADFRNSR